MFSKFHPILIIAAFCILVYISSTIIFAVPIVNIIFFLFGLQWWFGISVLLSMIAVSFLVIARKIGLLWLVLPITYFGGGFLIGDFSQKRAVELAASIESSNRSTIWRAPRPFAYQAVDHGAVGYSEIVERFRDTSAIFVDEDESTIRYFAKGTPCAEASRGFYYDRRFDQPWLYRNDIFPSYKGDDKTKQCILSQAIRGKLRPHYAVINEQSPLKGDMLNPRSGERFSIKDQISGRTVAVIETATLSALSRFPLLVIDCKSSGLFSSATGCSVRLSYANDSIAAGYKPRTDNGNPFIPTSDPMNSRVGALGQAIGLEPREPSD